MPTGSSTTTTKYSRQKLSLTFARPAHTPRSHAHSRSGLSWYKDIGSSKGHGAAVTTPLRTTGRSRSRSSSVAPSNDSRGVCTCTFSGGYEDVDTEVAGMGATLERVDGTCIRIFPREPEITYAKARGRS